MRAEPRGAWCHVGHRAAGSSRRSTSTAVPVILDGFQRLKRIPSEQVLGRQKVPRKRSNDFRGYWVLSFTHDEVLLRGILSHTRRCEYLLLSSRAIGCRARMHAAPASVAIARLDLEEKRGGKSREKQSKIREGRKTKGEIPQTTGYRHITGRKNQMCIEASRDARQLRSRRRRRSRCAQRRFQSRAPSKA
eukprot:3128657-Pleurochrysis_carterae.AAC.1